MTVVAPSVRRPAPLRWVGLVVGLLGLAALLGSVGWTLLHVGAAGSQSLLAPAYTTPYRSTVPLKAGSYTVYELVGTRAAQGPVTTTMRHSVTLDAGSVTVVDGDGTPVAVHNGDRGATITRGESIFGGAVGFDITRAGTYRIAVEPPQQLTVLVAPSFSSSFSGLGVVVLPIVVGLVATVVGVVLFLLSLRKTPRGALSAPLPSTTLPSTTLPSTTLPSTTLPARTVPAGWYPDPWQPGRRRYWDGATWTGHVA